MRCQELAQIVVLSLWYLLDLIPEKLKVLPELNLVSHIDLVLRLATPIVPSHTTFQLFLLLSLVLKFKHSTWIVLGIIVHRFHFLPLLVHSLFLLYLDLTFR